MASRAIAWLKESLGPGAEFTDVVIEGRRLAASGVAIGSAPIAYRLDYQLETHDDFVTSALLVTTKGEGWSRHLDLRRSPSSEWTIRTEQEGFLALPKRAVMQPRSQKPSTATSDSPHSRTRCPCCAMDSCAEAVRWTF